DAGAGRERLVVRHEGGQIPVQPQVERRGGLTGERVGAERDNLELGVGEQAVERLLAGVPGAADDRGSRHAAYYAYRLRNMQMLEAATAGWPAEVVRDAVHDGGLLEAGDRDRHPADRVDRLDELGDRARPRMAPRRELREHGDRDLLLRCR